MENDQQQQAPLAPPDTAQQPQTVPGGVQSSSQQQTDALGIVSVVLALFFQPAGLIVGIIGMKNAKKEGRPNTLSKVGVIINSVFMAVALLYFVFFMVFFGLAALSQ